MSSQPQKSNGRPPDPEPAVPEYPRAHQGQMVLWYMGADRSHEPRPAVVMRVNQQTLDLGILDESNGYVSHRTGVRHVDDPTLTEASRSDGGGWEHTLLTNAMYALIPALADWTKGGPEVRSQAVALTKRRGAKDAADDPPKEPVEP